MIDNDGLPKLTISWELPFLERAATRPFTRSLTRCILERRIRSFNEPCTELIPTMLGELQPLSGAGGAPQ